MIDDFNNLNNEYRKMILTFRKTDDFGARGDNGTDKMSTRCRKNTMLAPVSSLTKTSGCVG